MTETPQCREVRELLPELALDVAPGPERAAALAHVAACPACRELLDEAARTVDELMLLAPEHEPPLGFEQRVLAGIGRPARARRRTALLAAAAVLLVGAGAAGVTRFVDRDEHRLADQYRETLRTADGRYLAAAAVTAADGSRAGTVFGYEGRPSWLFVTVDGVPSGTYQVRMVSRDGGSEPIGTCWVRDGSGSWGTAIDRPVAEVDRVVMEGSDGTTLTARFT
jgi:hypothetical protein